MTGPVPSDEQLERIAATVQRRIGARARLMRQVTTTAVVAALLGGGVALLAPLLGSRGSMSTSGAAGGSAASTAASASAFVRCHSGSTASSPAIDAPLEAGPVAAQARTACVRAAAAASSSTTGPSAAGTTSGGAASSGSTSGGTPSPRATARGPAGRLVVCRDGAVIEVLPADDAPATLCRREGFQDVTGGVVPVPVGTPVR